MHPRNCRAGMVEPEKPFVCTLVDCGMTFTNEDHLHVHTKKHDMVLQLGLEQKAFVADHTPTPTRFLRNCEEVGLFQELQNVNPFEEGFKRAIEAKSGILSLESAISTENNDDVLHTPQMVFTNLNEESTLYATNQKYITISRSTSDEAREYETRICTNEVTLSRIDRASATDKDPLLHERNEQTVIFKSKDTSKETEKLAVPPIMSQRSLDFVVDSLALEATKITKKTEEIKKDPKWLQALKSNFKPLHNVKPVKRKPDLESDYEVIIKLPNGKQVRMKAIDEDEKKTVTESTKDKIKTAIVNKKPEATILPQIALQSNNKLTTLLPVGTLVPVTVVNPSIPLLVNTPFIPKPQNPMVAISSELKLSTPRANNVTATKSPAQNEIIISDDEDNKKTNNSNGVGGTITKKNMHSAASKRYRERLKFKYNEIALENKLLNEKNNRLSTENAMLKLLLTDHMKKCPEFNDISKLKEVFVEIAKSK